MAEEVIRIELGGSGGQAKSLQDLKKEYKDLQTELSKTKAGSDEYIQTLKKLGATKDEIGDLRDTISALNPEGKVAAFAKVGSTIASGFAAAQGAAALFGAESEELQKTMLKVQAAMALAEGIKGITAAGDAFAVLNTVMKANPILAIVSAFALLTAASVKLYDEFFRLDSASESLTKQTEELKKANDSLRGSIDAEIQALSGLKANEEEIIKLKEKKLQLSIAEAKLALASAIAKEQESLAELNYNEQVLLAMGKTEEARKLALIRTTEDRDARKKATDDLRNNIAALQEFRNIQTQKEIDENKKKNDKKLEDDKEAKEKYYEHLREMNAFNKEIRDENKREEKTYKSELTELDNSAFISIMNNRAADKANHQTTLNERIEAEQKHRDELLNNANLTEEERVNIIQTSENKIRAEKQKTMETNLDTTKKGLMAAQAITDLVFAHQLRQAKGNAEKEKEIRKKQFQVNKAFGIANAVVDGVGAVQKALNNPYPLNLVLAVISGVLAAANVVKIGSTKFDDGGGGGGSVDTGIGSIGTASAPAVPQPNNTVTKIDDEGKVNKMQQPVVKAVVVETDITDKQNRINTIEESAKFG